MRMPAAEAATLVCTSPSRRAVCLAAVRIPASPQSHGPLHLVLALDPFHQGGSSRAAVQSVAGTAPRDLPAAHCAIHGCALHRACPSPSSPAPWRFLAAVGAADGLHPRHGAAFFLQPQRRVPLTGGLLLSKRGPEPGTACRCSPNPSSFLLRPLSGGAVEGRWSLLTTVGPMRVSPCSSQSSDSALIKRLLPVQCGK